jgi:hypothetical protein
MPVFSMQPSGVAIAKIEFSPASARIAYDAIAYAVLPVEDW